MSEIENKRSENRISVLNWMGTLIVMLLPGVNIIAAILFIILANTQPKRTFAIAFLLVALLLAALLFAAFIFLPDQMLILADMLRGVEHTVTLPSL